MILLHSLWVFCEFYHMKQNENTENGFVLNEINASNA